MPRSLLHARLAEWLGALVDRHVPAHYLDILGRMIPVVNGMRNVIPGLKSLPALPANLPGSPAALKAWIAGELNTRTPAELAQILTAAQLTAGAWLAEYAESQRPAPVSDPDPEPSPDPVPDPEETLETDPDESSSGHAIAVAID